jgi:hypothetical protein
VLEESGALAALVERLVARGAPAPSTYVDGIFQELLQLERQEHTALIKGDPLRTRTLYQRS